MLIVLSIVLIVLSGLLLELWRMDEGLRSCWEVLRSVKFELGVSVFGWMEGNMLLIIEIE